MPRPTPPDVAPIDPTTDPRGLPEELTCWEANADGELLSYVAALQRWVDEVSSACGSVAP